MLCTEIMTTELSDFPLFTEYLKRLSVELTWALVLNGVCISFLKTMDLTNEKFFPAIDVKLAGNGSWVQKGKMTNLRGC